MKKTLLMACALIFGWVGVNATVNPNIKLVNSEVKTLAYGTQLFYRFPTPLVTGTKYTLTMRVFFENPLNEGLGFWPFKYGHEAQYTGFDKGSFDPGVWTLVTCNFTANDDHDAFQFPIGHVDGMMRIDDVKLVAEGSEENLVANGSFDEKVEHKGIWGGETDLAGGTWFSFNWAIPTFTYDAEYDDEVAHVFQDVVLKNYRFTPITIEDAVNTEKTVVLMNSDGKVFNGTYGQWNDGIKVSGQMEFDAKNYQLSVAPISIDGEENTYTIKLNESGSYNRYLQASMWGHAFFNGDLKGQNGLDGQNGAVWTIASMGENKYSLHSLGIAQGKISTRTDGYLNVNGSSEVRIDSKDPVAWTFATCEALPAVNEALTFSANRILDFSTVTDADAYIATAVSGNNVTMTKVTGAVPANTGLVLIQKSDAAVINIPTCGKATVDVSGNLLVATAKSTAVPVGAYVLAGNGDELGWYSVGSTIPTLAAGKCYLKASTASVKQLEMVFDDEATGVAAPVAKTQNSVYYNLQGVRVAQPTSGIYLKDGKKVIIKK